MTGIRDIGDGLHADMNEALSFVADIMRLYAPDEMNRVLQDFQGNESFTLDAGTYSIVYTYTRGPMIDERLLIISER